MIIDISRYMKYYLTNRIFKRLIIFFFLSVLWIPSFASYDIEARIDSVKMLMGKLNFLHISVVENEGKKGQLLLFKDSQQKDGYIGVCGDSIELRTNYSTDTIALGSGRIQINYAIPVQAFDSGTFVLPEFLYLSGKDTLRSNRVILEVEPLHLSAEDPIADFAPVAEPEGKKFYDAVPDWILDYWWIFLIIVFAICVSLWALRKYKKNGEMTFFTKPAPTPWELALDNLTKLKAKKLWEQGMEKEYFTELTDILRFYLWQRFGINALEMTTRQIISHISESDFKDKKEYVRQILKVADFVKFAKVRPLPADNVEAYENAKRFIEETIPQPGEEDKENEEGGIDSEEGGDKQ